MCPRDKSFEDEDTAMRLLAHSKLSAFDSDTHGQFFWNFRTEFEPKWDFAMAVERKWLPSNYSDLTTLALISDSCSYLYATNEGDTPKGSGYFISLVRNAGLSALIVSLVVFVVIVAVVINVWLETVRRRRRHCYVTIGESQTTAALSHHTSVVSSTANSSEIKVELSRLRRDGVGGIDEESRGEIRRPEVHEVISEKMEVPTVKSSPAMIALTSAAQN